MFEIIAQISGFSSLRSDLSLHFLYIHSQEKTLECHCCSFFNENVHITGNTDLTAQSRKMISCAFNFHSILLMCLANYACTISYMWMYLGMHWNACVTILTMRKQLRTLGSTLLPPKAATSPNWRGIWMASWSSRLRWRWSVKPPGPETWWNKSADNTHMY